MKKKNVRSSQFIILVLLILCLVNLVALTIILRPGGLPKIDETSTITTILTATQNPSPTASATQTEVETLEPTLTQPLEPTIELSALDGLLGDGVYVFSMADGWNTHLFAFHPQYLPLTRLTNGTWDDIQPAVSPDGNRIAFSSRANGYWDLFMMDSSSGILTRLTDTAAYDGHPSWSPDGQWLAFETYIQNHFEIHLLSIQNPNDTPIYLTGGPDNSLAPAWSPRAREIAFVSNRSGEDEIWVANLDQVENRFTNLSLSPEIPQSAPAWSADGNRLAWVSTTQAESTIVLVNRLEFQTDRLALSPGIEPVWMGNGLAILALVDFPNQNGLVVVDSTTGSIQQPLLFFNGTITGLDWRLGLTTTSAQRLLQLQSVQVQSGMQVEPRLTISPGPPAGRVGVAPLADVKTSYAYLSDAVDESFNALRILAARESGWDLLATLENAYLPLTSPPQPGGLEDWLFTGRGIAISSSPLTAGWMTVQREDYAGQTYWRVFIRARYQDGSQGEPLQGTTWDLSARYSGDPQAYEQGGSETTAPAGYWVDFTELALRCGWERLPAQSNWKNYFPATRFNQFANTQGLGWLAAMQQLYPPEALQTPTGIAPLVPSATPTSRWSVLRSPTPIIEPTRRPTWTPSP